MNRALLILLLAIMPLSLLAPQQYLPHKRAAWRKSAGGSPTWYDSIASGDTDANQNISDSSYAFSAPVTVGQSGNATKLRVYIQNADFDPGTKISLYNASSNLLATVTSTLSDASVPYSKEVTITSTAVTSGNVYLVAISCQAGTAEVQYRYKTGTGGTHIDEIAYASAPSDPYATSFDTGAGAISVGIYVEP